MPDAAAEPEFDPARDRLEEALEQVMRGGHPDVDSLSADAPELKVLLTAALDQAVRLLPGPTRGIDRRQLGPYVVEEELGRGGMGTVMVGRHESLGRRVALKLLPRPYSLVADNRERFRREAQAMAHVTHPHVLPIHEVGEEAGIPYAALELARGGTIEDILVRMRGRDLGSARDVGTRDLPGEGAWEKRVAETLAKVAEALAAVHAAGIVHRDIKPSNILLDGGTVYLGDFGLALHSGMATLTSSGAIVGTRHYLAPELTKPNGRASPSSDIYSLGVTLFEMLTLEAPFHGDSESSLFAAICEENPPRLQKLNRHVPSDLGAICLQAMEKSPEHRFDSAADMAEDLQAVAEGKPAEFARISRLRRVMRATWFRRRVISGVAVLLLTIAALTIVVGDFRDSWERRSLATEAREFVQTFRRGEALLMLSPRKQTKAALELLRRCERLRPSSREVLLRLAVANALLAEHSKAEEYVYRASALERGGAPVKLLLDMVLPSPRDSQAYSVSRTYFQGWPDIDRLLYAESLYGLGRRSEAFEIALGVDDSLLSPDLFMANCCHWCFFNDNNEQWIFAHREAHFRAAVYFYDSYLRRVPAMKVVEDIRALLIRDGILTDRYSGSDIEETLPSVIAFARRRFDEEQSVHAWSQFIKILFVAVIKAPKISGALDRGGDAIREFGLSDKLERIAPEEYVPIPSLVILAGDYEYALKLGRIRDLGGLVGYPGLFPAIVAVRWHWSGKGVCSPDVAALRMFLAAHSDEISPEERASCEKLLTEMEQR